MDMTVQNQTGESLASAGHDSILEPPVDCGESIAAFLIASGAVTEKQVEYARRVRSKLATHRTLFNVLRELGFVSDVQFGEALSANPNAIRLGDLLVELGHLPRAQLEAAIKLQAGDPAGKRLGEILVEHRF